MPSDESSDTTHELTLAGISSGEKRALSIAAGDVPHDFGLRTTVDVHSVTEENVHDLLEALAEVEEEMSDAGAYDEAEAASRMYDRVHQAAREEGLVR